MNLKENLTATWYFPERGVFKYNQPIRHLTYWRKNMDNKIIRDFQACLNEAIRAGWQNKLIEIPHTKAVVRGKIWLWFYNWNGEDEVRCSYSDLFFWQSWFLDIIEWKETSEQWCKFNGYYAEYHGYEYGLQYHKMSLCLLDSDEERMQYILDNMKSFITN